MSAQNQDNNETTEPLTEETVEEVQEDEASLASPEKSADSLEAQLEDAQAKASENWDAYHKYGIEKFVTELLPVLDSMGMGMAIEDASVESQREGMKLTMNMLEKMLEKLGIEEIDPLNEKFDADKHQAMTMQPNADVEPNTVIAVMQKGYALNGRLIRPAMVMVSKAVEES